MWYVISYDISDDRIRSEMADLLGRYGRRVHLSVFECAFEDEALESFVETVKRLLSGQTNGTDSVRIYRWCAGCRNESTGVGEVDEADDAAVWIV
jgi:CRISPR-associated protein Cas2